MPDVYKAYGPAADASEGYKDATSMAVQLLGNFVNEELYSKFSPSVSMNAISSIFIQMLVVGKINLDEFIPMMVEAVADFRAHMNKLEEEDDSGKD